MVSHCQVARLQGLHAWGKNEVARQGNSADYHEQTEIVSDLTHIWCHEETASI